MDKADVASVLEDIAAMLELKGENPFKIRAYQNAARTIVTMTEDLDALVRENRLTEIKGIGEALAEKIATLVTTGRLPYYEDLQKSMPAGLLDLIRIQGVGPKRAKILQDRLKIKDIPSLEKACRQGKIAALEGFGEKSQENILKGIGFLSQHAEYHRYDEALAAAESVLEALKKSAAVQRVAVCGSLRRHKEVIRDVDILVASRRPEAVMKFFVELPEVERVLAQGDTKASVLLRTGIQVDLRVLPESQFPFALHYFTGSKEHNIRMRQIAQDKGYKLSEYGLFKASGTASARCQDEPELFAKLGLSYIAPELREDRGEIEAARRGTLPRLVEPEDIRGAFHVHSDWSDGRSSLEAMVAECQRLGWEYVGISDHSKSAGYAHGLSEDRVIAQRRAIEALRKKFKIHIFWGTECDILKDGSLDYADRVLAGYDFVIASVHSHFTLPEAEMTRRIVKALKNKYVAILGHLTGRLLLEREAYALDPEPVFQAAAEEGVAVEINANPHRLDIDWRHIPAARDKGVRFSIDPDAHSLAGLRVVPYGVGIARKGWLTKEDVITTLPLEQMKSYLRRRRS